MPPKAKLVEKRLWDKSNKKLVETSALLVVTGALLVVTRS